jgi:hypothetical protein
VEACKLRYFNSFEFFDHTNRSPCRKATNGRWNRMVYIRLLVNWTRASTTPRMQECACRGQTNKAIAVHKPKPRLSAGR